MSWIEYTSYKNYPSGKLKQTPWECKVNEKIRIEDGLNTSWVYRDYLQKNTNIIINHNTKNALLYCNTNVINRGYSTYPSDLKQSFLNKTKTNKICCPSIVM
jgi:hypothetical protein